ncbi:hypothetical protein [Ruegeria lacuscaerulensis]|uniref:hypothetical protein n=1 Tax=Ruegeria lacuscaerulensis TaxID=55218 RepID=UPI00147E06D2|nr:hypothetical protein [Ruegeria lacuscaerulensis]
MQQVDFSSVRKRARPPLGFAIIALMLVSACGVITPSSQRVAFDGHFFKTKVKQVDKKASPTDFTVLVNDVSTSLDGARAAAQHEAIKFCIANFGSSRIDWAVGPFTETEKLRISDDKITFIGRCRRP